MRERFSQFFYALMAAFGVLFLINLFDLNTMKLDTRNWPLYILVPLYLLGLHFLWQKFNAWSSKAMEQASATDPQTGLNNSSEFFRILEGEIDRSRRRGHVLSVLFIDIDYFGRFNQSRGVAKGNAVLGQMGNLMRENTRKYDYPFRLGNDDFAAVLPETDKVQARLVAERIRELFYSTYPGELSLSIGLVSMVEGDDVNKLFRKSEGAMIEARRDGGNRVRAYVDRGMI